MNKVPIGKQLSSCSLVLVQEVPAGKACGCVCHSCGMELLARQGRKNIWHFAHSRGNGLHASDLCNYSAEVSVRDLILQEAASIVEFETPNYIYSKPGYKPCQVTTQRTVKVESVKCRIKTEAGFSDITLSIQGYRIHVLLRASGQRLAFDTSKITNDGVLRVCLTSLLSRIEKNEFTDRSHFNKLLCSAVEPIKSWAYHPRTPPDEKLTPNEIDKPRFKASIHPGYSLPAQTIPTVRRPPLIPEAPVRRPPKTTLTQNEVLGIKAKSGFLKQSAYHCKKCGHVNYTAAGLIIETCGKCSESSKDMLWKVS